MRAFPLALSLAAREATRTGLKVTLQRRLHGLLVIEARGEEAESDGDDEGGAAAWLRAEGACTDVLCFQSW